MISLKKFKNIFLSSLSIIFPAYGVACDVEFSGSNFLKSSYSKGLTPKSTCYITNVSGNKFYAFPDKTCKLVFANEDLLNVGWTFKSIQGKGTFSVEKAHTGITVIIEAAGGFQIKRVKLHSDTDNCENIMLSDVH